MSIDVDPKTDYSDEEKEITLKDMYEIRKHHSGNYTQENSFINMHEKSKISQRSYERTMKKIRVPYRTEVIT